MADKGNLTARTYQRIVQRVAHQCPISARLSRQVPHMPIPDFQAIMLPLLQELEDGGERSMNELIGELEDRFALTEAERAAMQPSGTLRLFQNRAHWAKFHLKKAGLIENPRRGVVSLSESGRCVLTNPPEQIDITFLKSFEPYQLFKAQQPSPDNAEFSDVEESQLAPPYDQLFGDFSNANRVLDRFADVLRTLQCDSETHDARVSVGLQRWSGLRVRLRLIYAKWAVFGYRMVRGVAAYQIVVPQHSEAAQFLENPFEFADLLNGEKYVLGWLPESTLQNRAETLWPSVTQALVTIHQQFSHWTSSPYANTNRPELYSIILNPNQRLDVLQTVATDADEEDAENGREYWLIAPGQGAKFWQEWQAEDVIDIGWEDIGSLEEYETKNDVVTAIGRIYPDEGAKKVAMMLWTFGKVMKPGDIVFVKRGRLSIIGWGVVKSDYRFSPARSPHPHLRSVDWQSTTEVPLPEDMLLATQTLTSMSEKTEFLDVMANLYGEIPGIEGTGAATEAEGVQKHWWLNANPSRWDPSQMPVGYEESYSPFNENGARRRLPQAFQNAMAGDSILIYITSPNRYLWGRATVTASLHDTNNQELRFRLDSPFRDRVSLEAMKAEPALAHCVPLIQPQGSLFPLTSTEFETLNRMANADNTESPDKASSYTREDAKLGLFMSEEKLDGIVVLLRRKRNIILQGAPGTGKTFVARRIAYLLMEQVDATRAPMVQFHQSMTYEDFIQGYRPDGKGGFILKNGTFHDFCRSALLAPKKPFVFIIDEINRGNLSKVFGELMMLIEADKREAKFAMPLSYSRTADDTFFVPPNVYLIGTMNTADRSLSLVDYALRRRFAFVELDPGFDSPVFDATLQMRGASPELVAKIRTRMNALNQLIEGDTSNLGRGFRIGHSFFVPSSETAADELWLDDIINFEIVPLIEEYWIDDQKKRSQALLIVRG